MMNRCVENMELLKTMGQGKDGFFGEYMEIPQKNDDNALEMYTLQCRNHILKPLAEKYGIDTSDEAIRAAVDRHNEVCRLIRQIGDFRKEANPRVTGYEFHILTMAELRGTKASDPRQTPRDLGGDRDQGAGCG